MIQKIPEDVLVHSLLIYFSKREIKRFLNTSRDLFEKIKYETLQFKVPASIYFQDQHFRTWTKSKIKNSEVQLHLHYDHLSDKEGQLWVQTMKEKDCRLTVDRATSLELQPPKLNRFPVLTINYNDKVKKFVGPLKQRKLVLNSFSGLSDVKALSRVQELELRNCRNLGDVDSLQNLRKLVINSCDHVYDVSQLGNIPDLTLLNCSGIRDVSALKNNKVLEIKNCTNISPDTVRFENVVSLKTDSLQSYKSSTYLLKAQVLELAKYKEGKIFMPATTETVVIHYCLQDMNSICDLANFSELKSVSLATFSGDLSPLLTVENVTLSNYKGSCLDGLGQNKMVKIIDSSFLKNVSALKSVPRVIIQSCNSICNWTDLRHVNHLTIAGISNTLEFTDFDPATRVLLEENCSINKLELINCSGVKSLLGLGNIPILGVKTCSSLVSLEGLGNNRVIILESNRGLDFVQLDNYTSHNVPNGSGYYMLKRNNHSF
jgi:hypothetical protein